MILEIVKNIVLTTGGETYPLPLVSGVSKFLHFAGKPERDGVAQGSIPESVFWKRVFPFVDATHTFQPEPHIFIGYHSKVVISSGAAVISENEERYISASERVVRYLHNYGTRLPDGSYIVPSLTRLEKILPIRDDLLLKNNRTELLYVKRKKGYRVYLKGKRL